MTELVSIASADLTARINPLGAELWSLKDGAGREYMTDADPAYWTGHAPLLFPIVGGLRNDRYRIDGQAYELPRHGFARRLKWDIVGAGENAVTFRLGDGPETRRVFPFPFEIAVLYALEEAMLSMVVRVTNPGKAALPFSFGFHPGFAWPLPGGGQKLAHELVFAEEEPAPIRRLDASGLIDSVETSPVLGKRMPLHPSQFEADAMIWDQLASRSLVYRSPAGPSLEIGFPDMPYLGVWQKPGADFICIEPWAGHADPSGFTGDLRDKPGIVLLEAGAERSFRMDVTVVNS